MKRRRSTKEPVLAAGNPLLPVVEALKSMLGMLVAAGGDTDFVRGKIEGFESAITLVQRAGAGKILAPDGQQLVKVGRPAPGLEERVGRLEALFETLRGSAAIEARAPASKRKLPAILADAPGRERTVLGKCERAILTVLAQRRGHSTSRVQLALCSGYSGASGGFANALGKLRSSGLIAGSDDIQITSAGMAVPGAKDVPPLPSGEALRLHWIAQLPLAEGKLLRALCGIYPRALSRDDLATTTGYSAQSGGFANAIGKLRTLHLVERGWPARASNVFFEESAR